VLTRHADLVFPEAHAPQFIHRLLGPVVTAEHAYGNPMFLRGHDVSPRNPLV